MRVQIYTQHYAPEVTAGRFRIEAFAERFASRGHLVDVICPVPNHPAGVTEVGYRGRLVLRRRTGNVGVTYLWVRASPRRGPWSRLAYYGSYAAAALLAGSLATRPDLILATSPPLTVGVPAALVASARRVPWILDVRDLWPEAAEVMGEISNRGLLALLGGLEGALYRSADRVVTVTRPFRSRIAERTGDPGKVELIPNGTTRTWLDAGAREASRTELGLPEDRFLWAYAGNVGPSRRLDNAIDAAGELGDGFQLVIVGDGPSRSQLERLADERAPGCVSFAGLIPATEAARLLRACDALLVPQRRGLGDFVPSKLYDCAALGRPLLAAADGETLRLATEAQVGLEVEPDSGPALASAVRRLSADASLARRLGENGRGFAREYQRERQGDRLVDLAEALVQARSRS